MVDFETVNLAMEELRSGHAPWAHCDGLREEPVDQESVNGSDNEEIHGNLEVSRSDMEASIDAGSIFNGVDVENFEMDPGVDLSMDDDLLQIKDTDEPTTGPCDAMITISR